MSARTTRQLARPAALALAGLLAFAPALAFAQDDQFDLRRRAQPTPEAPPVTGPVDPDNPVVRARPAPQPSAPPIVLPSATPSVEASATPAEAPPEAAAPTGRVMPRSAAIAPVPGAPVAPQSAQDAAVPVATTALPATQPSPAPRTYAPRNLDLIAPSDGIGLWLGLIALLALLAAAGWLAWSRYFRHQVQALPTPEIERPRPAEPVAPMADNDAEPAPVYVRTSDSLEVVLEATRMTATLMNTTLSYRLAVTNRSTHPLQGVRIEGDMISAHASRPQEPLFGTRAPVLPELHRIARLAPGESVTLGGDIRLPLVAITPIRRGDAALFVPLARLRARGMAPTGISVEGGGIFLVGQEPAGAAKLQPFRLDLGPRNYSRLGQHLLPAA